MNKIEEYIKEEMKGCPFTQEQEDKLLIGLTKFLDDLEQKQLRIGSVIPKGTLCCMCEKEKANTGYDMRFCKSCWDENGKA